MHAANNLAGATSRAPAENDLLERLCRLPSDRFEQVAQRLQQSDLVTLVRFAAAPHPLVHHALAVLQTVLLSLSPLHETTSGLRVAPWAVLRLDVLARADEIWRKMWKRLARLRLPQHDPRRKPLANAQVRFVIEHVLRVPLLAECETCQEILDAVVRVSAIAESVVAFVLLCAHYTLVPPSSSKTSPSKQWPLASLQPLGRSPPKPQRSVEPLNSTGFPRASLSARRHRSWRCGVKHGGRFFLFRAVIQDDDDDRDPSATDPQGVLSAFAIDCRHAAHQWTQAISSAKCTSLVTVGHGDSDIARYSRSWTKQSPVPVAVTRLIDEYRRRSLVLDHATELSLFLQTAVASELFTARPLGATLVTAPEAMRSHAEIPITMYVVVMATEVDAIARDEELKLVAIGQIGLSGIEPKLSDLRRQLVASSSPRTRYHQQLASSSFRFFLNGALVSSEDESWRRAIELLPLAVVCLERLLPHRRSKPSSKHWRPWVPTLLTIRQSLRSSLSKRSVSQREVNLVARVAVSLYSLDQSIASLSSLSVPAESTSLTTCVDTLCVLFVDWSAFVQFQQLQDTTAILYEYGSPDKPKRRLPVAKADTAQERLRPEPTVAEQELLSLPHEPFCAESEFLWPLYATFTFHSRRKAYLRSPWLPEVWSVLAVASESRPLRVAVENAECVVHIVRAAREGSGTSQRVAVRFARDLSCPMEMLSSMRDAFVWCIRPMDPGRSHETATTSVVADNPPTPPHWLRDVLRFVSHPTWDFRQRKESPAASSSWPFPSTFFHVDVPYYQLEQHVEVTLWSRGTDWQPHCQACDTERELLRPLYDAMCRAYPSSFSIDSVKFSKFLRECGLQPQFLSVGDAAFLFTNHRAPGSQYEMTYEGFVDALKWIARRVPPTRTERDETQQLRVFCLQWLIRAPSMADHWRRVVDRWRVIEKWRYMEQAAIAYCAATRIGANWKRFVVRRALLETLTRLKNERRAAAKVQSVYRMRKVRTNFVELKAVVIQTQRFVRARRQLRRLRVERAQLVEKMRRRLQKWMRQRLRVLRCWKAINAAWLARRARILEKRVRLVCAAAYQIESRLYRASLYKLAPRSLPSGDTEPQSGDTEYELELLEPLTSWFRSIRVASDTLDVLEHDAETALGMAKSTHARQRNRWKLLMLVQRLHLKKPWLGGTVLRRPKSREVSTPSHHWSGNDCVVQIYRDPMDTSLGRLVYQGSVQERDFYCELNASPKRRFVRLLLRSHDCTLLTYTPESSAKHRFTFTTSFVFQLFRVADWHGSSVLGASDNAPTEVDAMAARSFVVNALAVRDDKLLVIRFLLRYLLCHKLKHPTRDMMPEARERRFRELRESDEQAERAKRLRELELVVSTQSAARRLLAIRRVQLLAQQLYTKSIDPVRRQLVYTHRRIHDVLTYLTKPHSLRESDVMDPVDEWLLNADTSSQATRYFNPRRGIFSPMNEKEAALRLQKWFRRTMWTGGFAAWDLRHLSEALLFHHNVKAPCDLSDRRQIDQITNYALQRHLLEHDYKQASSLYEAALQLSPDYVPALVGLAVLLIYSCRYPAKQTWARGLRLLESAQRVDPALPSSLAHVEQNCFRWAMYLRAKNADAIGNYAVFLQCVRRELDIAEVLYRRAIDLDPANERIVENYIRLQRERTPEGIYSDAGPSKIAVWRAQVCRHADTEWRELEDTGARSPSATRFFQNIRTGLCVWNLPSEVDDKHLQITSAQFST